MNSELLARLIQKNGDRVVVADPDTGRAVVVMDLESYERLCGAAPAVTAAAPVEVPKMAEKVEKVAEFSEISTKKRKASNKIEETAPAPVMGDLTQEGLIDKINRDIGAWKTAQERKRTVELQSAAHSAPRFETVNVLEEEERFYLEPIE
jgi:lipoprotein-anchoring transpeptidase ErfK/SrfK